MNDRRATRRRDKLVRRIARSQRRAPFDSAAALGRLRHRNLLYLDFGDAHGIRATAALDEARLALAGSDAGRIPLVEAAHAVGLLHYFRHLERADPTCDDELDNALRMFALVARYRPDLVPPPLRDGLPREGAVEDRLRARISRFVSHRDASGVLAPEALREAESMLGDLRRGIVVDEDGRIHNSLPDVAHLVGWLHHCRHQALPKESSDQELALALSAFRVVHTHDPARVPEPLRPLLPPARAPRPTRYDALLDAAGGAATVVFVAAEPAPWGTLATQRWETAVRLLRRAVDAPVSEDRDRADHLALLADALFLGHDRLGRPDHLTEGISAIRRAVRLTPVTSPDHAVHAATLARATARRDGTPDH